MKSNVVYNVEHVVWGSAKDKSTDFVYSYQLTKIAFTSATTVIAVIVASNHFMSDEVKVLILENWSVFRIAMIQEGWSSKDFSMGFGMILYEL